MKTATVNVKITGMPPGLLMHRFPLEETSGPKKRPVEEEEIQKALYKTPDGVIYQPSTHILASMRNAGSRFQIKGRGRQTYKQVIGSGAILITPDCIPHEKPDYVIDKRAVVVRGNRIVRVRPLFLDWSLSFVMDIDIDEVPLETAYDILVYAGQRVGIGDWRPERSGPFGRFMVVRFERL